MAMPDKSFHQIELEAWSARASRYDVLFATISTQAIAGILDSLGNIQGQTHLDIACGTGHLVAAASQRRAISVGTDFAQAMIDAARAAYPNERFQVADAKELPFSEGAFDAVTCAFGLSHMGNPLAAMAEAFRVLRASGRFAFTLWYGPNDGGEVFSIINSALLRFAKSAVELPTEWVALRFADEQACAALARQVGFDAPVFRRLPITWHTESAQNVMDIHTQLSVRTGLILSRQPPDVQQRIKDYVVSEAEARRIDGVIKMAWPALLTTLQKP